MKKLLQVTVFAMGAAAALLVLGFILFATIVTRPPAPGDAHADGIVVLTGEGRRIAEGARLLSEGRAERMLISGVYKHTGKRALLKISGLPEQTFDCCVDLGYSALDTAGNADEARSWALSRRYGTLIIVTASYHMPRSLREFAAAMPAEKLVPYPVQPAGTDLTGWWHSPGTLHLLYGEYLKYLASLVTTPFESHPVLDRRAPRRNGPPQS